MLEHEGLALRQYMWLTRSKPILLLLTAWGLSYAGDLAAFTAASVYAYRAGGAGLVAVLGLLKALPGAFLVPVVTSGSDRVRRERLLIATVVPRVLLLGLAAATMSGSGQGVLVVVLAGLEGGLASAFRQVQAALLPWLARTPDEGVRRRDAVALFVPAAAQTFARGVLSVLRVVIALELFDLGSAAVGWLTALLGVGGLLVGPLAILLVRGKRVARSFAGGVAGWGVPMIVLAFAHAPYWPYLMFAVIGVANVFDDVGVYSSLQQVIPPRLMGRALGVRRGVLLLSMGLGSAVTPLLIHAWEPAARS
jgi:hypothetical protein